MRFSAKHWFTAPPARVAALMVDPDFYRELELPDLGAPEVVSHRPPDASADSELVVRYEYTGNLDPIARRLLGGQRLMWTQEIRFDGPTTGSLEFRADASPRLLHGHGDITLALHDDRTLRTVEGEVVVALPGVGAMAERRIVPGVLRRLDVEAGALAGRLGAR